MSGVLEPCPFCGRVDDDMNPTQESAITVQQTKSPVGGRRYRVECCCGASGAYSADYNTACALWDTRTDATHPASNARQDEGTVV